MTHTQSAGVPGGVTEPTIRVLSAAEAASVSGGFGFLAFVAGKAIA
jgi:hypothetical protein